MKRSLVHNRCDNSSRHSCRRHRVWRTIVSIMMITTTVNAFHILLSPTYRFDARTNPRTRISDQGSSQEGTACSWLLLHQPTFGRLHVPSHFLLMTTSSTTEANETNQMITDTVKSDSFFMSAGRSEETPSETTVDALTPPDTMVDNKSKAPPSTTPPPPPPKDEFVETFSKAAWQMGSDFFVALRWGAANALTSSLPENQRQILLERLDPNAPLTVEIDTGTAEGNVEATTPSTISTSVTTPNDDTDDGYERVTNSINEAVVASMVTKSQKDEQKWDREKEKILVQAEIAAQKRVETELAIQQQRYEAELQRLAAMETSSNRKNPATDDDDDDDDDNEDDDTIAAVRHPVLGPVLYDFGYKRLHLVPADVLATIPVWKKQRTYRHERAKSMSVDKMKTLHLGFPGVICIHEERSTGKIAIIDGQHRVGMMKILQEKQKQQLVPADDDSNSAATNTIGLNVIDLDHILVEVYTETEPYSTTTKGASKEISGIKDHAQDLFTEINKAEPVKLVDMPGVATSKERKMISQACGKLEEQYSIMFKPSQKCRPPNVNIDNLRDTIFASNILKRHNIQSSSQLYDWLIQQNIQMGTKFTSDSQLQSSLNDKVWSKAQTNDFYLGLDSSWLYS